MSLPFRCRASGEAVNGSTGGLCLNGGECFVEPDTFREYCKCPPGYKHDFTVLHLENCGMTEYAMPVLVGVLAAITLVCLMITLTALSRLRAMVKRVSTSGTLAMICNMGTILAIWIDGGAYEAMFILLFLFNTLCYDCLMSAIWVFAMPAYAVLQKPMTQFNRAIFIMKAVYFLAQLASLIPIIIFCRDDNPARFNAAVCGFYIIFSTGLTAVGILGIYETYNLKHQIDKLSVSDDTKRKDQQTHLQKRMEKFVYIQTAMAFVFILLWLNPVINLSLGSFPGQYILAFLMMAFVPFFVTGFAVLYSQTSPKSSSTVVSSQNNLSPKLSKSQLTGDKTGFSPKMGSMNMSPSIVSAGSVHL